MRRFGRVPVSEFHLFEVTLSGLPKDSAPQSAIYLARFENLDHVREFVGQAAQACGMDETAVYQVQLAVDEAFTNIVEHAYGGECDEEIQCTCQICNQGLSITLRDCGRSFDPTGVPDPDLDATLQERQVGGLGVYFIRQLMDEVEFKFITLPETGETCNLLRMFKRKE